MRSKPLLIAVVSVAILCGCLGDDPVETYPDVEREDRIPADAAKMLPEGDDHPPVLNSDEFESPIPLPYPVNTAGAEDSPFILPDGKTLYFFFTPDVDVPPEKQILDDVTGIYVSENRGGEWGKPERVWLQDPGKLALDGAAYVGLDIIWFASAREGYTGVNLFTAELVDGEWKNWRYVGDDLMVDRQVGEMHIHGDDLYYHSDRSGGSGGFDIWMISREDGGWSDPVNIEAVNTEAMDGYPFISEDGSELWFTRTYMGTPGIFRSVNVNDSWSEPELIVSQFAGEPTLDTDGNLYFVHHFYENEAMIEADLYVAYRK
ncbi:MAG: hypothetical protein ACMUIG_04220 [Thermoplasmatota archaeon]